MTSDIGDIAKLEKIYGWDPLKDQASSLSALREKQGRVFVVAHPRHRESGFCVEKGLASIALCHLPARKRCRIGDIVLCVTPPCGSVKKRYLLGIFGVDEIIPHSVSYFKAYKRRPDAIYIASKSTSSQEFPGEIRAIEAEEIKNKFSWRVEYQNGTRGSFVLKKNARYHRLNSQPFSTIQSWKGAKTLTERKRDFKGKVLLSKQYWRLGIKPLKKKPTVIPLGISDSWKGRLRAGIFDKRSHLRKWMREKIYERMQSRKY